MTANEANLKKALPSKSTVPIVSCDWLEEHLGDPSVRIVEVCSSPRNSTYLQNHIPGAIWCFWKDWCWHDSDREFVTPRAAALRLGANGITEETTLVFYGDPVQYGPYAAWAFTMAGHPNVRILDGGRRKWISDGRPLTPEITELTPVEYRTRKSDCSMRIGRDAIRAGLGKTGRILLDVRSAEEFNGERVMPPPDFDHGAERAGRIPGALHLHFQEILNEDDSYLDRDTLAAKFLDLSLTPNQSEEVIIYCRLSHRASLAWYAMRYIIGFENVKIYDGSWTEWGSIVGFPVEK
ncbi:MAG: sulfurtransferase [Rhizobiaceae bacterium]|nr:sulfurtransferase [Rhizobiaceae bacterium]